MTLKIRIRGCAVSSFSQHSLHREDGAWSATRVRTTLKAFEELVVLEQMNIECDLNSKESRGWTLCHH